MKGVDPNEVASRLDREASIIVKSGHHCCIPLMKHLGLGAEGTVRTSVYLYNTREEVERFLEIISEIQKEYTRHLVFNFLSGLQMMQNVNFR